MDILLLLLLTGAVVYDIRTRRIPNWLVLSGMAAGTGFHLYQAGLPGLLFSLKGLGLGIILLIVPFALGGMGAGDVKLLGMIGAFKGTAFVFSSFVWMALVGGVIAAVLLAKDGRFKESMVRIGRGAVLALVGRRKQVFLGSLDRAPFEMYFPYGLAIAMGAVAAYFKGWW